MNLISLTLNFSCFSRRFYNSFFLHSKSWSPALSLLLFSESNYCCNLNSFSLTFQTSFSRSSILSAFPALLYYSLSSLWICWMWIFAAASLAYTSPSPFFSCVFKPSISYSKLDTSMYHNLSASVRSSLFETTQLEGQIKLSISFWELSNCLLTDSYS